MGLLNERIKKNYNNIKILKKVMQISQINKQKFEYLLNEMKQNLSKSKDISESIQTTIQDCRNI